MTFCGFSSIASAGRMLFAFSRDDGVPGSRWLKKVSTRFRTPSIAVVDDHGRELAADRPDLRPDQGPRRRSVLHHRRRHRRQHRPAVLGVRPRASSSACGATRRGGSERTWSLGTMSRPFAVISVIWIILITPLFLYPFGLNPAALATVAGFVDPAGDLLPRVGSHPVRRTAPPGHGRRADRDRARIRARCSRARAGDCLTSATPRYQRAGPQLAGPRTNTRGAEPDERPRRDSRQAPSTPRARGDGPRRHRSTRSSWPSRTCRAGSWASASRARRSSTASSPTARISAPTSSARTWR